MARKTQQISVTVDTRVLADVRRRLPLKLGEQAKPIGVAP